ncbi:MAG TPA: hypothetical protein V6D17_22865 [Candidatus Obscuribacterales bacterium]
MFDYQAGEKYKLTLIMVAIAGMMAGMFFTVLLMPTPQPVAARQRARQPWMDHPDVTGRAAVPPGAAGAVAPQAPVDPQNVTDVIAAQSLIEQWLPVAWDLSAGSAQASQEKAIMYMTPECAQSYRSSIWTPDLAQQIDESGIKSTFRATEIKAGAHQPDGSIVIVVNGEQILSVPGQASRQRAVRVEYLVKQTQDGLRIAGISESKGG